MNRLSGSAKHPVLISIGNQQLVLRKMFVAAPHRGRKKGVGKQLLDSVLREKQLSAR
ncbi:MAG: GNAT family N-acetyltransferase [Leptolyngbyaceae cyanobacterium SM1_1_3]|nr:GNAT family N-acetyltransferase [Leptolyngbyaceae cyanobacterium SM1_1_3]NJN02616.1 GNAT family N-acetyltransferase [Leptolyngbyaceae cyanobacterium RM1_1_2]